MSEQTLLISTGNPGKFEEISTELKEIGISSVSLSDQGIELERPESGKDYHENARIKADEAFAKTELPSLADDSGLEVEALDGKPGVHSDRWAGDVSSDERNQLLLERLEGIERSGRSARFVCDMVLVDDTGERFHTQGVCPGRIAEAPRGERGFGYDPVFEVESEDYKTFAELAPRVKRWASHRGRALNKMISLLQSARGKEA